MLFHIFYASASITDESTIFITLSGYIHPRIFPPSEEKCQSGLPFDFVSKKPAKCPVLFDIIIPWKLIIQRIACMHVLLQSSGEMVLTPHPNPPIGI